MRVPQRVPYGRNRNDVCEKDQWSENQAGENTAGRTPKAEASAGGAVEARTERQPRGETDRSPHKFSEDVIQAFALDWAAGGPEAIARARVRDPSTYMRVVASILPKDVLVNVQQQVPGNLDPDDWANLRSILDRVKASQLAGAEPGRVFELIENALRADQAKLIDAE